MPSQRRPRQALSHYIDRLQAVVSCISHAMVLTDYQAVWLSEQPLALGRHHTLTLQQELHAALAGQVRVRRYNYRIADANDQEIVAYHYHPAGTATTTCTCRADRCQRQPTPPARSAHRG